MMADEDRWETGFTRCGFRPTGLVDGVLREGGVEFSPMGLCFLHLTRDYETGEYILHGMNFLEEERIPPIFADVEFTEFYRDNFENPLDDDAMKKITREIITRMARGDRHREGRGKSLVLF